MPRRAPELLSRIARRGAAGRACPAFSGMPHVGGGAGKPLLPTLDKSFGAQDQAASGWLFFGYFLLAKQKKVSRLSGRDPTLN